MKGWEIAFGIYWIALGIAAFCGVQWNVITVGCACIVAGLGCFQNSRHM